MILFVPFIASPRPFYPLQLSVTAIPVPSERSTPVHFLLPEHTVPVFAAVHHGLASASTSPCPAKLRAPRQSLRMTSLPSRVKSVSSGTAPGPSVILRRRVAALRDARHSQTENPHDPSELIGSHCPTHRSL